MRDHYRADQVALWTWLIPGLERVGSRHGSNSTFHRFVGGPGIFSGPTRPNSFLPPPLTTTPAPEISPTSNESVSTLHTKNNSFRMAHDASVRDRHGHMKDSLLGEHDLGLPYTTALSLTAALGVTLLVLNVLVLAAVHYRKNSHQKLPAHHRPPGLSPSHCGTIHSSTTLRSLACPQDWPPEYTTCYPENTSQMLMHQQQQALLNDTQGQPTSLDHQSIIEPETEQGSHRFQLSVEQPGQLLRCENSLQQPDHESPTQQYKIQNSPISDDEIDSTHQLQHHHLHHQTLKSGSSTMNHHHHSHHNHGHSGGEGSFRQVKVRNGSSTMKIVRKPSPPPRSSSVPPPEDGGLPLSALADDISRDPG